MGFMEKVFGDINTREVKKIEKTADQVMALDAEMAALSDEELKGKTGEFKKDWQQARPLMIYWWRPLLCAEKRQQEALG